MYLEKLTYVSKTKKESLKIIKMIYVLLLIKYNLKI